MSKFKGPEHFEQELEHYQGIEGLLNARDKEVKHRESKIVELDTQLKALKQELAEIQNSIKALKNSGVEKITKLSDRVMANLQTLAEETTRWGELKEEAGKFKQELIFAQYLATDDEATLKTFPKKVLFAFLERVASYCKLNKLNPPVRAPDGFSRKYSSISSFTEVSLPDLIAWVEVGLAGAAK